MVNMRRDIVATGSEGIPSWATRCVAAVAGGLFVVQGFVDTQKKAERFTPIGLFLSSEHSEAGQLRYAGCFVSFQQASNASARYPDHRTTG